MGGRTNNVRTRRVDELKVLKHPTQLDQLKTLNRGKRSSREWNVTTYKTENIKLWDSHLIALYQKIRKNLNF